MSDYYHFGERNHFTFGSAPSRAALGTIACDSASPADFARSIRSALGRFVIEGGDK